MRTIPTRAKVWIVLSALLAAGCATNRDAALEDAQFLLDKAAQEESLVPCEKP